MVIYNPVSKSKAAFLMSAEKLFNQNKQIYFWTFTFKAVEYDERAMYLWGNYAHALRDFFGHSFQGLRVVEIHGGEYSHGLHFHALLNKRISIHIVRRIGKRFGFGRISVEPCDIGAAHYLTKYLSKENELPSGTRKWAPMGGFIPCKVRNVVVESTLSRNIKWVQNHMSKAKFTYAFFIYLNQQTHRYGAIENWPSLEKITPFHSSLPTVKRIYSDVEPDDRGVYYDVTQRNKWEPTERIRVGTKDGFINYYIKPRTDLEPF